MKMLITKNGTVREVIYNTTETVEIVQDEFDIDETHALLALAQVSILQAHASTGEDLTELRLEDISQILTALQRNIERIN